MTTTKITARNLPVGYQTIISNGANGLLADEPVADHGTGMGFTPSELLLAGLAACKTMTVRYLARLKNWNIGDVHIELEMDSERREGQTYSNIRVNMRIEGDLTEEQKRQLLAAADKCPVHRILSGELAIEQAHWVNESPSA